MSDKKKQVAVPAEKKEDKSPFSMFKRIRQFKKINEKRQKTLDEIDESMGMPPEKKKKSKVAIPGK